MPVAGNSEILAIAEYVVHRPGTFGDAHLRGELRHFAGKASNRYTMIVYLNGTPELIDVNGTKVSARTFDSFFRKFLVEQFGENCDIISV